MERNCALNQIRRPPPTSQNDVTVTHIGLTHHNVERVPSSVNSYKSFRFSVLLSSPMSWKHSPLRNSCYLRCAGARWAYYSLLYNGYYLLPLSHRRRRYCWTHCTNDTSTHLRAFRSPNSYGALKQLKHQCTTTCRQRVSFVIQTGP